MPPAPKTERGRGIAVEHVIGPTPWGQTVVRDLGHSPFEPSGGGVDNEVKALPGQPVEARR